MAHNPFSHILVSTDDSARSRRTVATAVSLARKLGARMTAIHVIPKGVPTVFSGSRRYASGVLGPAERKRVKRETSEILAHVERRASAAGVPCRTLARVGQDPWRTILAAAHEKRCDVIVMGMHGSGVLSLIAGSQTAKVLTHSRIPVLVCR